MGQIMENHHIMHGVEWHGHGSGSGADDDFFGAVSGAKKGKDKMDSNQP